MRFISVTKPGIIFGNLVTVAGGCFLGLQTHFNAQLFLATLLGMSLIIASGCVANNFIDRDIDQLMRRTQNRVMPRGLISGRIAIIYAIFLGILGLLVLDRFTNHLTVFVALLGLFFYVIVYSLCTKRQSKYGTLLGAIAGAVPPVAGYCAVTNHFNTGAILLFLLLFFWQMPHFYAIAIYRLEDYTAAAIPVLPVKKNIHHTKITMLYYIAAFTIAAVSPSVFGYTGIIYFVIALLSGLIWFYLGLQGLRTNDDKTWARKMFIFSIINITLLSMMMLVKL